MMQPRSHKVLEVVPLPGFVLRVSFDNGVVKEYDLKEWQLGKSKMFESMGEELFSHAEADRFGRAVVWDDETDIAAYELYLHGKTIEGKRKQTIVWLDIEDREMLEDYAYERRLSLSEAIRQLIREGAAEHLGSLEA